MNRSDDLLFDPRIADWLEDDPNRAPSSALDVVLAAFPSIKQRSTWRTPWLGDLGAPRWPALRRLSVVVAAGAAAVVLVVAGAFGFNLWINQQGIGAPTPNPSQSPNSSPAPTVEPAPDLGIFEPVAGWIAYQARDDISAADPASTDPAFATTVQLTPELGEPLGWSPDGTRLLILRASNLYVLRADGTETLVTDQPSGGGTISPDGTRVVFVGEGGFYAVDTDGGPAELIAETDETLWAWTFAPDWTQIAYVVGRGDSDHRVWVMDFDGGNAHQIVANEATLGGGHVRGLAWSPAGDRIALALGGWVYTFAPDGSSFTEIAGAGGECHGIDECRDLFEGAAEEPYWSPDGSRIAFSTGCTGANGSRNRANCNLAIADADGSNLRVFGNAKSGPWHPGTPVEPTPTTTATPKPTSGGMWPQSTLDEVRAAQEGADAGDPKYWWQVDAGLAGRLEQGGPYRAEIVTAFLREKLGWSEFTREGDLGNFGFIRCATDVENSLYPDDPDACAPTIDDFRYESVRIDVGQPVRQDDTGLWVVTSWEMVEPFEQSAPLSEAEIAAFLDGFLQARVDGEGAEQYLRMAEDGSDFPFLYTTPSETPYERYEFEVVNGPMWPNGQMRLKVRLYSDGGDTVVEQLLLLQQAEQGLWYEPVSFYDPTGAGTTVNGQPVPVSHSALDGAVTFALAFPWYGYNWEEGGGFDMSPDPADTGEGAAIYGSMRPLGQGILTIGCQVGPTPADAEALAREIQSNPNLDASDPVPIELGGMPALQLDVTQGPGLLDDCDPPDGPELLTPGSFQSSTDQLRLYLVDLPPGSSATMLVTAFGTDWGNLERMTDTVQPILDSIVFHSP